MENESISGKPEITIIPDFIPQDEWEKVYEYARKATPKLRLFSNVGSPYRWKGYTHSKYPEITYERNIKLDDDVLDRLQKGEIQEPYPESFAQREDWNLRYSAVFDEEVKIILFNMTCKIQDEIYKRYGKYTSWEFGPYITEYKAGGSLRLHCDGPQYSMEGNPYTEFSSIYYINEDFGGGEYIMPAMGLSYKPRANSMILLSEAQCEDSAHGITKVESGVRYSSQTFFVVTKDKMGYPDITITVD
jgi:hypothetical protein